MFYIIFLELVIYLSCAHCNNLFFNLGGRSWSCHSQNSSSLQFFTKSAIVPGCIHSDLFRHNKDKKLVCFIIFFNKVYLFSFLLNYLFSFSVLFRLSIS